MHDAHTGPASKTARVVESRGEQLSAGTNFSQATLQLQAYFADKGTYVGATLPPAFGVVIARADAGSYCLQSETGTTAQHVVGPGGTPAAGPC